MKRAQGVPENRQTEKEVVGIDAGSVSVTELQRLKQWLGVHAERERPGTGGGSQVCLRCLRLRGWVAGRENPQNAGREGVRPGARLTECRLAAKGQD